MNKKIYEEDVIQKIRQERANGAKVMELAQKYIVHYRTIENYCRKPQAINAHTAFIKARFMEVV